MDYHDPCFPYNNLEHLVTTEFRTGIVFPPHLPTGEVDG